ncbi:OmpA family protein [Mesonia sp. K7]|uniref:OmpA family protein n=1 Tax=Mesonia sp. K7 TaxID=2218606 RepID=UPI000DA990E8|nr:OmpA family protein [Mesonia sp. K7]PZD77140.1 flagellar motor protein MotB [Mesonia sp. K7]
MKSTITLVIYFFTVLCYAQQSYLNKADQLFENTAYMDAIVYYEKYMKKAEDPSLDVHKNLGDAYYFTQDFQKALPHYKNVYAALGDNISDKYYFRYIQCLRSNRDYTEADKHSKKYYQRKADDYQIKRYIKQKSYVDSLETATSLYSVTNIEGNNEFADFGAVFYKNKVVYSASKKASSFDKTYSWNNQPYLDLYIADRNGSTGDLMNEKPFLEGKLNSAYHEAAISFSKNYDTIYFTKNLLNDKDRLINKQGVNNFHMYRGVIKDEKLQNVKELDFSSYEYSVGHPAISSNGKWLFFASDMPGGLGESDIYMVKVFPDGTYNTPENIGKQINTEGKEMFPFVIKDKLYFASNGHYGYGGLDIYVSTIDTVNMKFSIPKNLGKPINSNRDDFSFVIDSTTSYGYIASNRKGPATKGDDDIFYFRKSKPICNQMITGTVIDSITTMPIRAVRIAAHDEFDDAIAEVQTKEDGTYIIELPCDKTYTLRASKQGYTEDSAEVVTQNKHEDTIAGIDFMLTNYDDLIKKEDDKEMINVNPIYFEYDKSNITPQAEEELAKVLFVLREFPKIKIKIEAHTDSRGKDSYNLNLSQARATSTKDYILSKGIDASRLESAIGYGETQLKNECANGVECSEEQHQLNRRSDFIIIEK